LEWGKIAAAGPLAMPLAVLFSLRMRRYRQRHGHLAP